MSVAAQLIEEPLVLQSSPQNIPFGWQKSSQIHLQRSPKMFSSFSGEDFFLTTLRKVISHKATIQKLQKPLTRNLQGCRYEHTYTTVPSFFCIRSLCVCLTCICSACVKAIWICSTESDSQMRLQSLSSLSLSLSLSLSPLSLSLLFLPVPMQVTRSELDPFSSKVSNKTMCPKAIIGLS